MSGHRRHKGGHEEEHENHERWLISYADMMTLLVALFMMMYAMSVLDVKKFEAFQEALQVGLGSNVHALPGEGDPTTGEMAEKPGDPTLTVTPAVPAAIAGKPVADREQLEDLQQQMQASIDAAGLTQEVKLALDDRGLVVFVTDGALFSSGTASIDTHGAEVLSKLVPTLASVGNDMIVEGHTDDVPIATAAFPSNWELSTARATSVLRNLIGPGAIPTGNISAAGYADTHPRAANDGVEHRAQNRRVEIVVVAPTPPPAAEPAAAPAAKAPAAKNPAAPPAAPGDEKKDSGGH